MSKQINCTEIRKNISICILFNSHESLGMKIDLTLTHLEIFKTEPQDLKVYEGDANVMLSAFCKYNKRNWMNRERNVRMWDVGLYLTGWDMHEVVAGQINNDTLGMAHTGGACNKDKSCAIAQIGPHRVDRETFEPLGYHSVMIAVHEIGHT